jgi:hypothetical protein
MFKRRHNFPPIMFFVPSVGTKYVPDTYFAHCRGGWFPIFASNVAALCSRYVLSAFSVCLFSFMRLCAWSIHECAYRVRSSYVLYSLWKEFQHHATDTCGRHLLRWI